MQETIPERPEGAPTQVPGQEPGELPTATPEESIGAVLIPGEQVAAFGGVLRMDGPQRFEQDVLALTSHRRLILAGAADPWGFQVKAIHDLGACVILNGKERPDGSRLLAIQHDNGRILLHFATAESRTADALVAAIGVPAPTAPAAAGLPSAPTPPSQPAAAAPATESAPEAAPPAPAPPVITGPRDDVDTFALTQFLHDLTEADINGRGEDED